jgi:hypothetical protein
VAVVLNKGRKEENEEKEEKKKNCCHLSLQKSQIYDYIIVDSYILYYIFLLEKHVIVLVK